MLTTNAQALIYNHYHLHSSHLNYSYNVTHKTRVCTFSGWHITDIIFIISNNRYFLLRYLTLENFCAIYELRRRAKEYVQIKIGGG